MSFWENRTVLVTGGGGFLGKQVVKKLEALNCESIHYPASDMYNLKDVNQCWLMLQHYKPNIVIHLAALCGGIQANKERPGTFFYDNAIMGLQLIEEARKAEIEKFVCLGTICAYPKFTPVPFKEDDLWLGYPEETNAPYGLAKKMLMVQLQAYRQQYEFNGIFILPVNLYGIGDNFDLNSSHVIPAMIRKFLEAKERSDEKVTLWGTGEASREFLYVEDCAEGILKATELYNSPEPCNLGSGVSILIKDLAQIIKDEVGFTGNIEWDTTKPDGQPKRQLDVKRAEKEFGFVSSTSFREGLRKTIAWYLKNRS